MKIKNLIPPFFFVLFAFQAALAAGDDGADSNKYYKINIDKATIDRGYTVEGFGELKLSLVPGVLSSSTDVEIVQLGEDTPSAWNLDKISNVYQFEFKNKAAYDNHKPYYIQFSYDKASDKLKQVYFYDKNFSAWRPLPTKDFPEKKFVRSLIHLPFARIAVFEDNDIMTVGKASWYAHKGGDFAASPDFVQGSKLRVFNLKNGKFVDVKINDHGPDRKLHPDRVVDLDKTAFAKIASLGQGVIDVKVEPLETVGGALADAAEEMPVAAVRAAAVFNEDTGEFYYEKNSTLVLPLASLTKLVAIKIFLDTRPSLNAEAAYLYQDEAYNYEWCKKWESARLKVDEGDIMTVENLIYAALAGSANNTVETLIRISGLARPDFIKKMNETAALWGASSTKFVEPTGLSPQNVTTARDYAIITKEVFKNPIIQKASTMPVYEFYTINTKKYHRLVNTNSIIKTDEFNITGSKTGYLDEAGYCLMTRAKADNGSQIITITLGAKDRDTSFRETSALMQYGLKKT